MSIPWISVRDNLPNTPFVQEISVHWEVWSKGKIFDQGDKVAHALYDDRDVRGAGWYVYDKHKTPVVADFPNLKQWVTAWRNLPEPYKESDNNNNSK